MTPFHTLPLEERLAILAGNGELPDDPRLIEYRESLHEAQRGLSAEPGAHERYARSIAPYLQLRVEQTPASMRKFMMKALAETLPLGAVAVAFRATEEELEYIKAGPVYEHEPVDEIDRLARMPYKAYLRSEHWQKVRADALERAEHRCQICNRADRLEVHHRDYKRRGCERAADVVVLCAICHSRHHGTLRAA